MKLQPVMLSFFAVGVAGLVFAQTATQPETAPAVQSQVDGQYWMGVAIESLPHPMARQLKLKPDQGLVVIQVLPGSPAEKAGLKPEDFLLEIDGKPLTSQEDLAKAANIMEDRKDGTRGPSEHKIAYLRDGDRGELAITPTLRPNNMLVMGGDLSPFTAHAVNNDPAKAADEIRSYITQAGDVVQVGPGVRVKLAGESEIKMLSALKQSQAIVLSQSVDPTGAVKYSLTVGGHETPFDPAHLDALQPDLRDLAGQLVAMQHDAAAAAPLPPPDPRSIEQRVHDLEEQNRKILEQNRKLEEVIKKLADAPATQPSQGTKDR